MPSRGETIPVELKDCFDGRQFGMPPSGGGLRSFLLRWVANPIIAFERTLVSCRCGFECSYQAIPVALSPPAPVDKQAPLIEN